VQPAKFLAYLQHKPFTKRILTTRQTVIGQPTKTPNTWQHFGRLSAISAASTMATPASTTSHEGGEKKLEQITFRFCSECSNMLYPKEDAETRKLMYTCRTCQYTEEAQSSCVFRNVLNNAAGETAGVTQDVGSDPTVSVLNAVACVMCGCPLSGDTWRVPPTDADEGYESKLARQLQGVVMLGDLDVDEDEAGWEKEGKGVNTGEEHGQGRTSS
jgi:DNA-directed RNA polymerase subunit M/transcription elongation factor TFIIS